MTTITNTPVKPIETPQKQSADSKKTKENKGMKTGGAIALSASLATLASLGTYIVMRGKSKNIGNYAAQTIEMLQKNVEKLGVEIQSLKNSKEDLKRIIRSKEDMIEDLKITYRKTSDELLSKLKELGSLKRELKNKDEKIKILENKLFKN